MSAPAPNQYAFRHEALLYAGTSDFLDTTSQFIQGGLAAGEPVFVVVSPNKIEGLRARLGDDAAERVDFADMGFVGSNPARIIPAWRAFLDEYAGQGGSVRGIGEPIYAERESDELLECQHHEELLNVAFDDGTPWWLVCPYDTTALPLSVIDVALQTHPFACDRHDHWASTSRNGGIDTLSGALSDAATDAEVLTFDRASVAGVRSFVATRAVAAGLNLERAHDLSLAAHEAATNSARHGGGRGTLSMWSDDRAVVCEVRDAGRIVEALVGRLRPDPFTAGGRGVWIVHQLCDLSQVRSSASGTVVRMHMKLDRVPAIASGP
jgi:anti-sigma regulatory factor (Ser/Thr protein kinase)